MNPELAGEPAEWLDQHGDCLYSYALKKVRDTQLAEDLVQDTLLAAIAGRHRFEGRCSVRTWLVGILKHKLLDLHRRQARDRAGSRPGVPDDADLENWLERQFTARGKWKNPPRHWNRSHVAGIESEEFRAVLARCMERLPPRAAEAIVIIERQGLASEQLGNVLGTSTTNVNVLLYRARSALRRCLEAHWFGKTRDGGSDVL